MILIGTAGPAGSGKDTVADYLVKHHSFEKMAFAGPLKVMLASVGLAEPEDRAMKEQLVPGFEFTWRQAAQDLGTKWGRGLEESIWLKLAKLHLDRRRQQGVEKIVFTDLRFTNEATMLRNLGGQVWHLIGRQADLGANAGHVSEKKLDFFKGDRIIQNNDSLAALHLQVEFLLVQLTPLKGTE